MVELAKQLPDTKNSKDNFVVERYIERPYLIDGHKFDLRLYVGVTSYEPLKVYLHEEGLIRLASSEYSTAVGSYGDRFSHLTNYSINKKNVGDKSGSATTRSVDAEVDVSLDGVENADVALECSAIDGVSCKGNEGNDNDNDNDNEKEKEKEKGKGKGKGKGDYRNSEDEPREDMSIKLRLSELGARMQISDEELMELRKKIDDLVTKTLISAETKISMSVRTHCSFLSPALSYLVSMC